jgi:hypothetical protein
MSRYAGKRGQIYLGIADSAATAEPLPFVASWSHTMENEKIDVTTMDDDHQVFLGGMANPSGEWSGFHDDSTSQSYTAAGDGLPRKWYLYPNRLAPLKYFFGTVICDMTVNASTTGAVEMSANWSAASKISPVGI